MIILARALDKFGDHIEIRVVERDFKELYERRYREGQVVERPNSLIYNYFHSPQLTPPDVFKKILRTSVLPAFVNAGVVAIDEDVLILSEEFSREVLAQRDHIVRYCEKQLDNYFDGIRGGS